MTDYISGFINGEEVKYYPETGVFMTRDRRSKKQIKWKVNKVWEDGRAYLQMCIGKNYLVHRVLYKLYNPEWDIDFEPLKNQIDHINQTKNCNDIDNLRVVDSQKNQFNRTSKGCSFNKRVKKWLARIKVDNKSKFLGYFMTEDEAHKAYLEAKAKYHII